MAPTSFPGIPDSPAIAPRILDGFILSFFPIFMKSLTILESSLSISKWKSSTSSTLSRVSPISILRSAAAISIDVYSSWLTCSSTRLTISVRPPSSIVCLILSNILSSFVFLTSSSDGTGLASILVLQYLSISLSLYTSLPLMKDSAMPDLPARPVRPILCT